MNSEYKRKYEITYTELNQDLELGLTNAIELVQSILTDYFVSFGSDNETIKNKNNALWVLSKKRCILINFQLGEILLLAEVTLQK